MKSAGNDIVALKAIDKQRTSHPVFYLKFLSEAELALYQPPDLSFEAFVWLVWSIKESTYKYLKRLEPGLLFSPIKIIVQAIDPTESIYSNYEHDQSVYNAFKGAVQFHKHNLYFESVITNEYSASVVNNRQNFKDVYWGIKLIEQSDSESQSAAVRSFTIDRLTPLFPERSLHFRKNPVGYPILLNEGQEMDIPISFSHHDRYISYSFLLSK